MDNKRLRDEHLEKLWYMKEDGINSFESYKELMKEDFNEIIIEQLKDEDLLKFDSENDSIEITKKGENCTRQLIRAHRIAERMLHDVMGGDFEIGACEFEHTVALELVDSICTLLGHPRECPHGLPIPEGNCCKNLARVAESLVIPLTDLKIGQSAKIVYVNCKDDQLLHKIDGMHIRPGSIIKLHQNYPTYVVECEGVNIALDTEIAKNICIWKNTNKSNLSDIHLDEKIHKKRNKFKGFRFRFGRKK